MTVAGSPFSVALRDRLRTRVLSPGRARPRVGAELEWIVLDASGAPAPIFGTPPSPGTLDVARALARRHGWCERRSARGAPVFALPCGGVAGWEPGGQLEVASAPYTSVSSLLARLIELEQVLREVMEEHDMTLISTGIDPHNAIDRAPLRARCARYDRMARYFAHVGPAGARMMRQSAALQLSIDPGAEPALAWRATNAMAPVIVAMFASSPRYAGEDTGCASFRAENWRHVDPARTGLFAGDDLEGEYLDFALRAPAMLLASSEGEDNYLSFGEIAAAGAASLEDWDIHLTTLFPEVRPRPHLELRSADAVPAEKLVAPLALVCGVLLNHDALVDAIDLLGAPDWSALISAGRSGLRDASLRARAVDLVELAVRGCRGLPVDVIDPEDIDRAEDLLRILIAPDRSGTEPGILAKKPRSANVDAQTHVHTDVVGSQCRGRSAVVAPVSR